MYKEVLKKDNKLVPPITDYFISDIGLAVWTENWD